MGNVIINGRTAVHAGSGGVFMAPDTCQVPPLCIPASFTNVALSKDATGTASSVIINGQPACHLSSTFMVSSGDEGGSCGGIISGTIKGQAQFITSSPNVFIEGQPAVRQADQMVSNNANTPPAPLQQPGAGLPSDLSAQETDEQEIDAEGSASEFHIAGHHGQDEMLLSDGEPS
ncbi:MAG: DUF4150 domain-containing protein [Pseudomonadota bacterium]|nr:DUF4150 domain-containing protein [Pseudomonadota bacterium]MEE3320835.1 DUF4150 domain-containing protein [Pseudomonadota bacterium]